MKTVAKTELVFHETKFTTAKRNGQIWFTATDLAHALQYANMKSITNLFHQNSDEFSPGMSQVIESVTSGNYRKRVRIFSLRGAHLLAMFARTPIAKEFRQWVLDILERESSPRGLPTEAKLNSICPCCGKPSVIIESRYITRYRTEIISKCERRECPDQLFSSEISFSYYIDKADSLGVDGVIWSLSSGQRERLIRLLSTSM